MDFSSYPKVELHCHLDCSLSYQVVQNLDPTITREIYMKDFIGPVRFKDLASFLDKAISAINLMQSTEQLDWVTEDLIRQFKAENVVYGEIRFAPFEHIKGGLKPYEVVDAVNNAVQKYKEQYKVEIKIILCTLRHFSEEWSLQTVELVDQFKGTHVVGFDIASDEAGYPIDAHVKAFQYARSKAIPCTAHAGEAKGAESMWETIQLLTPARIGHGVRCVEDEALMDYLKTHRKHLEICPSSNIQTRVVDAIETHPVDHIYRHGISCSINTDNRTITHVTLSEEYAHLYEIYGWNKSDFLKVNLEAINHAFAEEEIKERIRTILISAWSSE